jgi:hypothetical protein
VGQAAHEEDVTGWSIFSPRDEMARFGLVIQTHVSSHTAIPLFTTLSGPGSTEGAPFPGNDSAGEKTSPIQDEVGDVVDRLSSSVLTRLPGSGDNIHASGAGGVRETGEEKNLTKPAASATRLGGGGGSSSSSADWKLLNGEKSRMDLTLLKDWKKSNGELMIVKSGWVEKRRKILKTWSARFICLCVDQIVYWGEGVDGKLKKKGVINLGYGKCEVRAQQKKDGGFWGQSSTPSSKEKKTVVESPQKSGRLSDEVGFFDTADERLHWVFELIWTHVDTNVTTKEELRVSSQEEMQSWIDLISDIIRMSSGFELAQSNSNKNNQGQSENRRVSSSPIRIPSLASNPAFIENGDRITKGASPDERPSSAMGSPSGDACPLGSIVDELSLACEWKFITNWSQKRVRDAGGVDPLSVSPTYPELLLVPASMTRADVMDVAKCYLGRRFPLVAWRHPTQRCVLARSSQRLRSHNKAREKLLENIRMSCCTSVDGNLDYPPHIGTSGASRAKPPLYLFNCSNTGGSQASSRRSSWANMTGGHGSPALGGQGGDTFSNALKDLRSRMSLLNGDERASEEMDLNVSLPKAAEPNFATSSEKLLGKGSGNLSLGTDDVLKSPAGGGSMPLSTPAPSVQAPHPHGRNRGRSAADSEKHDTRERFSVISFDLPNIAQIQTSYQTLKQHVLEGDGESVDWHIVLHNSRWLPMISSLLDASLVVARALDKEGVSCVVECSEGRDHSAIVSSTVQIMLDSHYRTTRGFMELAQKEWCGMGHPFAERQGIGCLLPPGSGTNMNIRRPDASHEGTTEKGTLASRSPVMFLWLHIVWNLLQQFPDSFEFNEELLLLVVRSLPGGKYGTFMFNSAQNRWANAVSSTNPSVWDVVLQNPDRFAASSIKGKSQVGPKKNATANISHGAIWPDSTVRKCHLWEKYWFGWGLQNQKWIEGAPF